MDDYYHDQVTQKSWELLQELQRVYQFTLIGGWAVYLYTRALKSKDIDIAVTLDELGKIKADFEISKNERLKKYEAHREEIDIDIYVEYYSDPGLPVEALQKRVRVVSGFTVPEIEYLLILKMNAWHERKGSLKGEKDQYDIVALLHAGINMAHYIHILHQYQKEGQREELAALLAHLVEAPVLNLNEHQFSRLKKVWLKQLREKI
ncbi:MAG: hypothetical protein AB1352_05145 [Patescibacteria group bacterium]